MPAVSARTPFQPHSYYFNSWYFVLKTDMAFSFIRDRHMYEENFIVRNCAEGEIWTPDQGLMSPLLYH